MGLDALNLPHITTTSGFREAILREYPALDSQPGFWPLLEYLLFCGWSDEESGELILPASLCALMEGKTCDGNYNARTFLEAFSADVAPITWRDNHLSHSGKARTIIGVDFSEEVLGLAAVEKRTFLPNDRVWLSTGNKYRREDEIAYRRHTQAEALAIMDTAGCQEAFELLSYLNTLAPNRFTAIKKHLDAARSVAETTRDPDGQLRILKAIESQAQPFYKATDKTSRIFALNESFLRLQRDVRKVITQEWVNADLRSAQLAIIAKVWGVPEVAEFLKSGKSIWRELCAWLGLEFCEENKQVCKDTLYSIIFGAGNARLTKQLDGQIGCGATMLRRLKEHPVIRAIFAARALQLRQIRSQGYAVDAFGKKYEIQYFQVEGKPYKFDSSRSALALVAQSYELKLLYPVVKLAMKSEGEVAITMWLHDGFCFDARRGVATWQRRFASAVAEQAEKLGIATELELSTG